MRRVWILLFCLSIVLLTPIVNGKTVPVGKIYIAPEAGNGIFPVGVAVDEIRNRIYTANWDTSNISVIDGDTRVVEETLRLDSYPNGLAMNVQTNKLYVTTSSDLLYVIDADLLVVETTIPVGSDPQGVDVHPYINRIYTANCGEGTVSVIDGNTNNVIKTIPVGEYPVDIAIGGPTVIMNQYVYVTDQGGTDLYVIDILMNQVVHKIKMDCFTRAVDVNWSTNKVYVSGDTPGPDTVFVIDEQSWQIEKTVPVGYMPVSIDSDETDNMIYVSNWDFYALDPEKGYLFVVSAIDGSTHTVSEEIVVGQYPNGVAVDSINHYAYVSNERSNTVSVIDGQNLTVEEDILTGAELGKLDVHQETGRVYIYNNTYVNRVFVADRDLLEIIDAIEVIHPCAIAVNTRSNNIFVGNAAIEKVTVIDGKTHEVITRTDLLERPVDIAVNEQLNLVYIGQIVGGNDFLSILNGKTYKLDLTRVVDGSVKALAANERLNTIHAAFSSEQRLDTYDGITLADLWSVDNLGNFPTDLALHPKTRSYYIPIHFENSLWIMTPLYEKTIPVGQLPWAVTLDEVRNLVYVANTGSDTVSVVDGKTNEVVETICIEGTPGYMAVDYRANYLYVCNQTAGVIEVFKSGD